MKKAVNFLIFVPTLFFCIIHTNNYNFYDKFKNYNNATFCYVYSSNEIDFKNQCLIQVFTSFKTIKNAEKTFLYFNKIKNNFFAKPDYMQVCFSGDFLEVKNIIKTLNLKKVFSENFENYFVYYGFSSSWSKYKLLKNKKVNFQIVLNKNNITIGYPMIYSSY